MPNPLPRLGATNIDFGSDPANSGGVSLSTNASANTKATSWTELIASTSVDAAWMSIQAIANSAGEMLFDIGTGASTSEVVLIPNLFCSVETATSITTSTYLFPVQIAAGTRISARAQGDAGSQSMWVSVQLHPPGASGYLGCGRHEACGVDTAATGLTTLAVGAVANTDTAFSAGQLIASTAFDYRWLNVHIAHIKNSAASACNWLVDLGLGTSGSETVFLNDIFCSADTGNDTGLTNLTAPIAIAAGTRLAARARCSITTATDREIMVAVWGSG